MYAFHLPVSILVLVGLVFLSLGITCYAETTNPTPKILFNKELLQSEIVSGREFVVSYEIYNVGDGAAYDLEFEDMESWPENRYELVCGLLKTHLDKLAPGENFTNLVALRPKVSGRFELELNTFGFVQYRISPKGEKESCFSTNLDYEFDKILPRSEKERKISHHLREWFVFVLLVLGSLAPPAVIWSHYQIHFENGIPKMKKEKHASKALKIAEKQQSTK